MITWLASYPKSGNTWIRMFLSAYRNNGQLELNRVEGFCWEDNMEYFHGVVSPIDIRDLTQDQILLIHGAALLHMLCSNYGKDMLVKTHHSNAIVTGISLIPVQLTKKAIYVVRDPRDMVVSFAAHMTQDIDTVIESMTNDRYLITKKPLYHFLGRWDVHVKTWAKEKEFPVIIVRYEDMVEHPEATFKALLDFLDTPFEEERFEKALAATQFDKLQEVEKKEGFREQKGKELFFRSGKVGGWRDVLTGEQVKKIELDHGEVMRDMGYLEQEVKCA